jgi:hypothetical protein
MMDNEDIDTKTPGEFPDTRTETLRQSRTIISSSASKAVLHITVWVNARRDGAFYGFRR